MYGHHLGHHQQKAYRRESHAYRLMALLKHVLLLLLLCYCHRCLPQSFQRLHFNGTMALAPETRPWVEAEAPPYHHTLMLSRGQLRSLMQRGPASLGSSLLSGHMPNSPQSTSNNNMKNRASCRTNLCPTRCSHATAIHTYVYPVCLRQYTLS